MKAHKLGSVFLRIISPTIALGVLVTFSCAVLTSAQGGPGAAERVAALKKSLAESRQHLKQYEWIETTVVSLKGEEKSRKQNRCYYGADGGIQKVPLSAPAPQGKQRGLKGKIAANKKEELSDYMERAVSLVKRYVPPSAEQIQAVKDAGKVSMDMLDPGKRIRLNFRDYVKPGDNLGIEFDLVNNRILGATVASYLDDPKDTVQLDVRFALLEDGTNYTDQITPAIAS